MPTASGRAYLDPTWLIGHLNLKTAMHVGDFGVGGAAHYAVPAAERVGQAGIVFCVDVLQTALSAAAGVLQLHGLTNCKAVWANLEIYGAARGIPDNDLDAGIVINVLHQSAKYKDILAEIQRTMKSGAKLLVVDWLPDASMAIAPAADRRLSTGHVRDVAQSLGYASFEEFRAGKYHWGLVLVKT